MRSEARVATAHGARYMAQLCKHFGHRVPAQLADDAGRVAFPDGLVDLAAEPGLLVMRVSAGDPDALSRLEGVLARHLERFAFREPLVVSWSAA